MSPEPRGLKHLARAYFHQDYDLDAPTPLDVVRLFAAGEPPATVDELASTLSSLLDSSMTDEELRRMWIYDCGASYDPAAHGVRYRQWFASMLEVLAPFSG